MKPREEKLMKYFVEAIPDRLGSKVEKLAGKKARQGLESVFDAVLENSCFQPGQVAFRVQLADGSGNWEDGEELLGRVIEHASKIIGSNTVRKEVGAILADAEQRAGSSLYEIYYRLGIHSYQ